MRKKHTTTPEGERETVSIGGKTATITRHDRTVGGRVYQSYRVRYWQGKDRKEFTAPTIEEARSRAKKALKHHESGAGHVMSFSPAQAANVEAAFAKLSAIGVPLLDAVAEFCAAKKALGTEGTIADAVHHYLADRERRMLVPMNVPDLVVAFLAEKKAEGVSKLYLDDITRRLDKFAASFKCPVASVTTAEIADWLKRLKATGRNGNNYRNAVCTVLSYARERGHLPREKKTEAELLRRFKERAGEIGIYAPREIRRILGAASEPMRPAIAIGAFAGLRSMEIFRLDWQDVNLEAGHIVVAPHKAKTAQRRIVPVLPNLRAWLDLTPADKRNGRLSPPLKNLTNFCRNVAVACEAAGVEMKANGLRHSFASYRLAAVQSAEQVILELGNSRQKLFQHYRELVTPEAATAWFNVCPDTPIDGGAETSENVIPMRKGRAA